MVIIAAMEQWTEESPQAVPVAEPLPSPGVQPSTVLEPPEQATSEQPVAAPVTPVVPVSVAPTAPALRDLVEEYAGTPFDRRGDIQARINSLPESPGDLLKGLSTILKSNPGEQVRDAVIDIAYGLPNADYGTLANMAAIALSRSNPGQVEEMAKYHIALALMDPQADMEGDIASRMFSSAKRPMGGEETGFNPLSGPMSRLAPYILFLRDPDHPPPGSKRISPEIMAKFPKDDDRVWEQYKLDYWDNRDDRVDKAKDWWLATLVELKDRGVDVPDEMVEPRYRSKVLPTAMNVLPVRKLDKPQENVVSRLQDYFYDNKLARNPRAWSTFENEGKKLEWVPLFDYYLRDNHLTMDDSGAATINEMNAADEYAKIHANDPEGKPKVNLPESYLAWLKRMVETGGRPPVPVQIPGKKVLHKRRPAAYRPIPDFHKWLRTKLEEAKAAGKQVPEVAIRGVDMGKEWLSKAEKIFSANGVPSNLWANKGSRYWLDPEMLGSVSQNQIPSIKQFMRHPRSVSMDAPIGGEEDAMSFQVSDQDVEGGAEDMPEEEGISGKEPLPASPRHEFKNYDPDAFIPLLPPEKQEAAKEFEDYIKPEENPKFKRIIRFITDQLYEPSGLPRNSVEERTRQVLAEVGKFYSNIKWSRASQDFRRNERENGKASTATFWSLEPLLGEPLKLKHSEDKGYYEPRDRYGMALREVVLDILNFISDPESQVAIEQEFGPLAMVHAKAAIGIVRTAAFVLVSNLTEA